MKIAVAAAGNQVSSHFGHCEGFFAYSLGTSTNEALEKKFIANPGHRPGFLPVFLKDNGINVIIAGGMGASAQELFKKNNIEVIVGAQGYCDEVIQAYVKGDLKSSDSVCHEHQFEGSCHS